MKRHSSAAAIGAALLLAACQSRPAPADYVEFRSGDAPSTTASRIAENIGACWFAGGRPAFAAYSYVPELASYSDRPRILIVPESDPTGLPRLVVEASPAEGGSAVKLFGPLMTGAEAQAINRDVARWAGGTTGC